ncbi:Eco57I restriction-modification methylase domain-containing protein [Alkalibacterium sp. MB6]|uniref:Eco57I restriction-modification methylase domain-containing protein n=1 Tax=Alkalibacterium sp. MB6 TaxID=2081965 RepID=UPI00137A3E10|nr:Eco57I restriction-modification methylase domain-containing protein [Alkalibacterium sp. MB6]
MVDLGQVFTTKRVSDFMVSLFSKEPLSFLDPCFGEGVFIKSLLALSPKRITGYELDSNLFNNFQLEINNKFTLDLKLRNQDFLLSHISEKYDGIILNPPYLRHEKIDSLSDFGITKKNLKSKEIFKELPSNSNFYMYFITKCLSLLKEDGEMVIIFPGSWKGSTNEKVLNNIIEIYSSKIVSKINIIGNAFETSPLVDVIVLKIVKTKNDKTVKERNLFITEDDFKESDLKYNLPDFDLGFPINILKYANTKRGLTTGANSIFVNPSIRKTSNLKKIISSPKDIIGYNANNTRMDNILYITKDSKLNDDEIVYLENWQRTIIETEKPKTLHKKIQKRQEWYTFKKTNYEGIIFGYIIRDKIRFILNDTDAIVRDNFYVITPIINKYILLSLLNNHYTYYQLEKLGKRHGKGVLKIQKYDLDLIVFPDISKMETKDMVKLESLGKKIINHESDHLKIIENISKIISNYSCVSYQQIIEASKIYKKDRMDV